jgi:hypothetical protein
MSQTEMIQASLQVEAGRELRALAHPLIHKIIDRVRLPGFKVRSDTYHKG